MVSVIACVNKFLKGAHDVQTTLGGVYKPRGQTRGKGGCSDDHNT